MCPSYRATRDDARHDTAPRAKRDLRLALKRQASPMATATVFWTRQPLGLRGVMDL